MAKIIHDQENCIGCGACVSVCPKFWDLDMEKGKAVLKGGKKNATGKFELQVADGDVGCNKEAVDVCPVQVISVNS